ncbi:hypothetical protein [Nitrosomonas eutropha]|uniref:hypothetical protein n=1 Tax=Nitrosomonas eutropha TaxID=916 RepID=UPI0015A696A6|nr:hypothetical protein [Nitrosomonas eutropha]
MSNINYSIPSIVASQLDCAVLSRSGGYSASREPDSYGARGNILITTPRLFGQSA